MGCETLQAPAKLNLALDILRRRADGYHEMRMVMQTISLCDVVTLQETALPFSLHTDGVFLQEGKRTLEQRAAEAFFETAGKAMPGLAVTLCKKVPAYAGLGGGSADVAALLRLLRAQYCPEMTDDELERIGLQVGSDVPFCVRGGTALAEGRGEILTDLPPFPSCGIVLCKPDFDIPTPSLFARVQVERLEKRPDIDGMRCALAEQSLIGVAQRLGNVFESVLPPQYHEVFAIKRSLLELGALNAAMSGSGPTVFGIFSDVKSAEKAGHGLRKMYSQVFLAQPVTKFAKME